MPAIQTYQQGFVLCNKYWEAMDKCLPMKADIGEEEVLKEHEMWLQDFELLKAQFCNNMSACYCKIGDLD